MNTALQLFRQQYGQGKWTRYDGAITRLRCAPEDHYAQMVVGDFGYTNVAPVFACKFAQKTGCETLLGLANEDGKLVVQDTLCGRCINIQAHHNAIFDLAWMSGQMKVVTASGDHSARLIDLEPGAMREVKVFLGHTRSVKTVSFRKGDPSVFATGGRDGNIIVWDIRAETVSFVGKPDRTISNSHVTKSAPANKKKCVCSNPTYITKSVTGLVFQNDNTLVSCGAGDGVIKIWDLRKNFVFSRQEPQPRNIIPHAGTTAKNGFSGLTVDESGTRLYANSLDNIIYTYNLGTCNPTPVFRYSGHQNSTFYIKSSLSRDGSYIMSGSSDENAYIWHLNSSHPVAKLTGHYAEVNCVAWCDTDDLAVVTCSDDMSHKVWRVAPKRLPFDSDLTEYRGRAVPVPYPDHSETKRPCLNPTEESPPKQFAFSCRRCENASTSSPCDTCDTGGKRKQLGELTNECKRAKGELGPRRLFQNLTLDDDDSDISNEASVQPLIENLPNFAIDGVAPHLQYSPPKRKDRDWLTKMRIERQLRHDANGASSSSSATPPKQPKLDLTPKRSSSPQSPLLKFFKVKSEGHGCSSNKVNSGSSTLVSSPRSNV